MLTLLDTHYHFDFIEDQEAKTNFIKQLNNESMNIVAQTVLPSGYVLLVNEMKDLVVQPEQPPYCSLGFHPWWIDSIDQVQSEIKLFEENLNNTRFIGEIGLDFSTKRVEINSVELQRQIFQQILYLVGDKAKNSSNPYILSIHAVHAVTEVIDMLEASNSYCNNIVPILHRFSGTSDELTRHIRLGGYISVHPQMLDTKKGRAYVRQIPSDRILLETDLPTNKGPNMTSEILFKECQTTLINTLNELSELRHEDIGDILLQTQHNLYDY